MTAPFVAGAVASLVTPAARRGRYGTGGTSFPSTVANAHARARALVEHGAEDWSEVRAPADYAPAVTFRAWRVSDRSFAWQTSVMPAPAFAPYTGHAPLITDRFGTYCPECRA